MLSARLELEPGHEKTLWYEIPAEQKSTFTDDAVPFVVALALSMAQEGRPVRVHGRILSSLLKNLDLFLSIWSSWKSERYSLIYIIADDEQDRKHPNGPDQAVCDFSCGVDSSITAYHHAKGINTRFPEPLTADVMAPSHGLLIPNQGHCSSGNRNN